MQGSPQPSAPEGASRPYGVALEMGFVLLVVLVWQAARVPLEGTSAAAVDHARSWSSLERRLGLYFEASLVEAIHGSVLDRVLDWAYLNIHLPILFGYMTAARLLAPARYPVLRTTFLLAHVPAVVAIGLYPLAPPRWLPDFPYASGIPTDDALTGSFRGVLENSTAAVVSQHFGYPFFIAAATIWMAPRAVAAWCTLLYPASVFFVIVGTGQHWVLDAVTGALTFVFAGAVALRLHRGRPDVRTRSGAPLREALGAAAGCGLVVLGVEGILSRPLASALSIAAGFFVIAVALRALPRRLLPRRADAPRRI